MRLEMDLHIREVQECAERVPGAAPQRPTVARALNFGIGKKSPGTFLQRG